MSLYEVYTRRPPVKIGADGLPHCGWCSGETLCNWHRTQVRAILSTLKTPHLLASAVRDLRYVIHRPSLDEGEV